MIFGLTEGNEEDAELVRSGGAAAIVARVVAEVPGVDPASEEARLRACAPWCFARGHSVLALDG